MHLIYDLAFLLKKTLDKVSLLRLNARARCNLLIIMIFWLRAENPNGKWPILRWNNAMKKCEIILQCCIAHVEFFHLKMLHTFNSERKKTKLISQRKYFQYVALYYMSILLKKKTCEMYIEVLHDICFCISLSRASLFPVIHI